MTERKAPKDLKPGGPGRRYWRAVCKNFDIEDFHVDILLVACQALDRAEESRQAVAEHGLLIVPTGGGIARLNPAAACERESMNTFLRAEKQLGLDSNEAPQPGRPSGAH